MKKNFLDILDELWVHEGGYVDHPSDPGGATKMGITRKTLADWRGIVPFTKLPKSEVKNLTREEAAEIYRIKYWNKIQGDKLPSGIDSCVMDYTVNSGPVRAVIHLQEVLGVAQDGKVGPITLKACFDRDPKDVIGLLTQRRMRFLQSLSTWPTFGKGWTRRVTRVRDFSIQLVDRKGHQPLPNPAPERKSLLEIIISILVRLFRGSN